MNNSREKFKATAAGVTLITLMATVPAFAQQSQTGSASQSKDPEAITVESVVVTGEHAIAGGLMKQQTAAETVSSITPAAIGEKLTAASPLQLVSTLPGVNYGNSDAYGLAVRNFISVRGLDQTEIGWMVEGIPGVQIGNYFPYTETWSNNEDISDITLIPGNSRLQDPILNASGGEYIMSIRDPGDDFGGSFSSSAGSYGGWRMFGRLDSGVIDPIGAKAFISYAHTDAGNYTGPGRNRRDHLDFKMTKDWSTTAKSSLFVAYDNWSNARIPIPTLAQAQAGIATNFDSQEYSKTYTPGVTTNFYKANETNRSRVLVANNNEFKLGDSVTLHVTPYYEYFVPTTFGEVALTPTSVFSGNQKVTPVFTADQLQAGKLFTQSEAFVQEYQYGVNAYLQADLSDTNQLIAGYWHENWHASASTPSYILDQAGNPTGAPLVSTTGALITSVNYRVNTATDQFVVQDTQSFFDDTLKVSIGFKDLNWTASGQNFVIGAKPTVAATWSEPLPRVLVSYDVNPDMQIYANVTTNARMPAVPGTYLDAFSSTTGAATTVGNVATKPEYTTGEQIGYRWHGLLNVDVSVFHMNLENHQVSSLQIIDGSPKSTPISAGGETLDGASAEVATQRYDGFSAYGNLQYLNGTFNDNISVGADFLPTKGRQMVESPNWVGNLGLRYELGGFFAEATGKYVSKQYSTFMNDQVMPSYATADLSLGYRLPDAYGFTSPVIRVNMTNLSNQSYISSVASIATNAVAAKGIGGTTVAAGTPTYYVAAPLAFMVTLSSDF